MLRMKTGALIFGVVVEPGGEDDIAGLVVLRPRENMRQGCVNVQEREIRFAGCIVAEPDESGCSVLDVFAIVEKHCDRSIADNMCGGQKISARVYCSGTATVGSLLIRYVKVQRGFSRIIESQFSVGHNYSRAEF